MKLADSDIEDFMKLCEEEDGVRPSREMASEAATRVVLLYERLLLPTPHEMATAGLQNQNAEVGCPKDRSNPIHQHHTSNAVLPIPQKIN